jgi:predicted metal-dependent hydrolase
MSDLKIRKIGFRFQDTDFIWNPENPFFSILMNKITFFVIGFEKYICQAINDAEPLIKNPAVLKEAKDFRTQESIHSMAHRKHAKALIERYPGLQETLDKVVQSYDRLYASKPLKYHLAYIGGLESIFTPFFKLLLDNRKMLFGGGDAQVSSLLVWHFCEEIEHRSSGIIVYDEVVGSYLYRVLNFRKFIAHSTGLFAMMDAEFQKHVADVPIEFYDPKRSRPLPLRGRLGSAIGVLMAQMPWHKPVHQSVPDYFQEWMGLYDSGADMTQAYGVQRAFAAAPG